MIFKKINWNTVYKKQSPELLGLCMRYVKDQNLAEDLLHDAFLTAIDKIETFKNIGSFNGWLKKIVLNTILQHLRQSNKLVISKDYDDNILQKVDQPESIVDKKYIIAQADFSKKEIVETLETLPEHHRIVFNLYVFEGYKHTQISKMLEISVGTSKSSLSRARKKLIELLYAKAEVKVKEEKKSRKVFAALWILPLGEGFIDSVFEKKLKSISIEPKQNMNTAVKEVTIYSYRTLAIASSVVALFAIISISFVKTINNNEIAKEPPKEFVYDPLVFNTITPLLNSGPEMKEKEILKKNDLKTDTNKLPTKDDLIERQKMPDSNKYCDTIYGGISKKSKEGGSVTLEKILTIIYVNNKNKNYLWKGGKPIAEFYYSIDIADSAIIGKEWIEFTTKANDVDDSFIRFYKDSTYCFRYNHNIDTIALLDSNSNTLIPQIIKKSDKICGKGWLDSKGQYANFIAKDSLIIRYCKYLRGGNEILFRKITVYNTNSGKYIYPEKPSINVQKAK